MALRQLSLVDLVAAVQKRVEDGTGLKCYDFVRDNTPAPFIFIEVVRVQPADTKTTFRKSYEMYLHIISDGKHTSVPLFEHIQEVQEALTEDIILPEPYHLISQTDGGVQTIQTDETGEKHAVIPLTIIVSYGWKIK